MVVTAAAGGIGSLLVQAARNAGATVVAAVGGPVKVAHARAHGADITVDYDVAGWGETARSELDGRAAEAHRAIESRATVGKSVLTTGAPR